MMSTLKRAVPLALLCSNVEGSSYFSSFSSIFSSEKRSEETRRTTTTYNTMPARVTRPIDDTATSVASSYSDYSAASSQASTCNNDRLSVNVHADATSRCDDGARCLTTDSNFDYNQWKRDNLTYIPGTTREYNYSGAAAAASASSSNHQTIGGGASSGGRNNTTNHRTTVTAQGTGNQRTTVTAQGTGRVAYDGEHRLAFHEEPNKTWDEHGDISTTHKNQVYLDYKGDDWQDHGSAIEARMRETKARYPNF